MELSTILDPVDALAYHFRSFGTELSANKTPLRIPPPLKLQLGEKLGTSGLEGTLTAPYSSKTTANLVGSISNEEFERWCLLDATAFIFVTRILLEAEPCLAKDQGLFRLIEALETLRDQSSTLSMPERLLTIYKNTLGESLAAKLLDTFIDSQESGFSRRWAGMLLVELLEESEGNRNRVWKMPQKLFKEIGDIIISGGDRILKIVAGKIIWQLIQAIEDEEEIRKRLPTFYQSDLVGDFTNGFPLQSGSQWESGFASFINEMELNRYDLNLGSPNGYTTVQVMLGKNSPISSDIGAITINIAEIFSIYIPPNVDRSPDWVDLKIVNISKIEFTKQILTKNSMNDLMYLKLHLHDYDQDGYLYLLSMRPSSDSDSITILCYKNEVEDLTGDIEKCREKVLLRKGRRQISSAPLKDIQANPEHRKSQQEKINELERHREDILKVLESPITKSDDYASSLTDPDEFGDEWEMGLPGYKPAGPQEGKSDIKEREKENSRIGPMVVGAAEEFIMFSPAQKPSAPGLLTQGRCTSISSLKDPTRTSDIILESGLLAPITLDFDPKHIHQVTLKSFSSPLRSSASTQELQKVMKPKLPPIHSSQPSRNANSNYKKGLEEVFDILKGKTPGKLWDNPRHHPDTFADEQRESKLSTKTSTSKRSATPQKKPKGIYKPKPVGSAKHLKLPSGALTAHGESTMQKTEYFDITAMDNPHGKPKNNPPFQISEKQPSRNPPVKENISPIPVEKKSKETIEPTDFSIPDNVKKLRTPPHTYSTKNRAKGAPKSNGKTLNKDGPPNKNNLHVIATKSAKSHIPPVKLDTERLPPSDDTSIWELPVSEESEIEFGNEKKKGTIHLKKSSSKKPAPKLRQPIKPKPPPKKRIYGKKSIAKPELKSKEIISNSDKELEVESPPTQNQKQNPRSKNKGIPKTVPHKISFKQDSEDKSEDQVATHPLRPKVKPRPKPKSRSAPASGLTNRTLPKRNEDEQMKSPERESIRASTPPTPTPKPRKKELAKPTPAKHTGFENISNDEYARPSSQRSGPKTILKSLYASRSAKHNESEENWLESLKQKKSPTTSTKLKNSVEITPASVLTKRAASPDDNDNNINRGEIGPLNKRKKEEQSKISQTTEKARRRPLLKKTIGNSRKRFKSDAPLNTSEADEDSSWRPKTRLQAKLELKNSGETQEAKMNKARIPKEDLSGESTKKIGAMGQLSKKSSHRVRRRKTVLSEESCEDDVEEAFLKPSSAIVIKTSEKDYSPPEDKTDLTHNKSSSSESETGGKASISRVISDDGTQKRDESQLNKRRVLSIDSKEVLGENQAPTAVMNPVVPNTHHAPSSSKNPPENHFQGSALRHKRNQDALLTLATPTKVTNGPKTLQPHLGALINDRLARKAQIISWGSSGPQNQGRVPIIEKSKAVSVIREVDSSTDVEECGEQNVSFSGPESGLGLVIIESGDEDHVIIRKKAESSLSIHFDKKDTSTVIGMDESPLTTPMRRASTPTELPCSNGSDDESRNSSPVGSEDGSDAVSDFEIGDIGNDDQEFPAIQDVYMSEKYEPGDKDRDDTLRKADLTTREKGPNRQSLIKKGVNIIELSSDSSDSEARHQNRAPKQSYKRSYSKPNKTFNPRKSPEVLDPRKAEDYISGTKGNLPVPDSYVNQKPGTEWRRPVIHQSPMAFASPGQEMRYIHSSEDPKSKLLDKRWPPAIDDAFAQREYIPTMARNITSGAKIAAESNASELYVGRKLQKTGFSKWLQESGFKKVTNDSHDNRKAHCIPKGCSQSRDPDKTAPNESIHGDSEMSQGREQKQQRNNYGKKTLGNESDDSDTGTSDYEDSDTDDDDDGNHEDEDEESLEDEHQKWRQSVPDYHLESLSVLNQISRGLLRYLMSGEELAMEIVNDFEKKGREIAEQLGASHRCEYEEFLTRVKLGEKKVQMEHAEIMEAVGKGLSEITRRSKVLKDVRTKLSKEYEALDVTISTMMANLEEDLERSVL
ncbi:hypothetical protein DFP73DRAFT_621171 [Morchella snyderi]|nr:hypothetical protein DFP73DRAFT_621171 [Morchella snyderi]